MIGLMTARNPVQHAKEHVFPLVLNAAILLDFKKGHLRWTMSELSRTSGVTRSLIYYYFGKSKIELLKSAIEIMGQELFGITPERKRLWAEGKVVQSIQQSRERIQNSFELALFYLLHRGRPTEIGERIRRLEKSHLKKLDEHFPDRNPEYRKALFGLFLGLVVAPDMTEDVLKSSIEAALNL